MTNYQTLLGWYKDDEIHKTICGNLFIKSTFEERINNRLSNLNLRLNRCKRLCTSYIEKQRDLKHFLKYESKDLSDKQKKKIENRIKENSVILRGVGFYISHIKEEIREIQKSRTNNMKKKD